MNDITPVKTQIIFVKSILNKSKIYEWTLNPYIGCSHGCRYCYARFMKKFTGHLEPWGEFVDIKINAAELLPKEVKRKPIGKVWISGVCDPYQPVEKEYELTRRCLEILVKNGWPISIQTKSPLVLRDLDLLKKAKEVEVCLSLATSNERIKKLFELNSPTIEERIEALRILHQAKIPTRVMIAPLLPGAEGLVELIKGKVDSVFIDRMNYNYANWVYNRYNLKWAMEDGFFYQKGKELQELLEIEKIDCKILY